MKLSITSANKIENPPKNYGFAFIDAEDKKLKVKKHDSVIEFANTLDDIQLLDLTNYTAFEVLAHDYEIPSGQVSNELSGYVNYSIPANMMHAMYIRSSASKEINDVVIDWGDGEKTILSKLNDDKITNNGEYKYFVEHTYKNPGKYIIKIYGKDYWAILPNKSNVSTNPNNLMCRVFDEDLPIASHLYNLSSFCYGAIRLLNVNVWHSNFNGNNIQNTAYLFTHCRNLLSAIGFYYNNTIMAENNVFENCWSLETTNYQLHPIGNKQLAFHRCYKLTNPIEDLLPDRFEGPIIDFDRTFNECKALTGNIPNELLWDNTNVKFTNISKAFYKCSDEIKLQAPISWGGTASDNIIEKSLEEKYNDLLARVEALESK